MAPTRGSTRWRRRAIALVVVTAACSGQAIEADIDCDPMGYQLDNEVWVLREGVSERLSEPGMVGVNPSLSPDGNHVAFATGEEESSLDLHVMTFDVPDRREIWNGESIQSSVDWSPDGATLVFDQYSERDGGIEVPLQVFRVPSDGSAAPTQLTDGPANGKPKWGSDGRILFLSLRDAEEQEIYSMNPDGSDQINLTNHPARDVLAELSPDGTMIAFASDRAGNGDFDLWVMGADGSDLGRLTDDPGRDTNPTWTSDGNHIIFRADRAPSGLWVMSPDGSNQRPLLDEAWLASCP